MEGDATPREEALIAGAASVGHRRCSPGEPFDERSVSLRVGLQILRGRLASSHKSEALSTAPDASRATRTERRYP